MAFRQGRLAGLAFSVGVVVVLYWQAASGRGFFFERDVWLYWIPHIEWASRTLASGQWPEWNPFVGFGAAFMADPSFQFFYPPSILNWLLPPRWAYTILVVGHATLGALGAFRLLRPRLRCSRSAMVGAVIFVAAGPMVSSANLWHHFSSAMYMPWVLDAFLRVRSGRRGFERLGFIAGLQALAGSADVCAMEGIALLFLLPLRWRRLRKLIPRLGAATLLCVLLASIQWLPTALLASQSSRSSHEKGGRMHWSVSPRSLVDFLLPLNGTAHAVVSEPEYVEERERLIPWMYLGASTLPLIVLGARRAPHLAVLLLLTILLSMGRHTPLAPLVADFPLLSTFRFPSKILWLVSGCWAILAAIGLKDLSARRHAMSPAGILIGLSLIGMALAGYALGQPAASGGQDWVQAAARVPWSPLMLGTVTVAASLGIRKPVSLVALVVIVDLLGMGQSYNAYASGEMFVTRPSVVQELRKLDARRIYVFQKSRSQSQPWRSPEGWSEKEAYTFGLGQFLLPPQSVRWGIKGSFDGDFTGLARPEYSALVSAAGRGDVIDPRLLSLAGVTHAIRFEGPGALELPQAARVETFFERAALVLEVPDPLPHAYVVHHVRREESWRAGIEALSDPAFDRTREIVRLRGDPGPPSSAPGPFKAHVDHEAGGTVVVRAQLSSPGTLVLLNAFAKGWHARVDGKPKTVQPANLLFQSVDLDAGDHLVEFDYKTPGLLIGLCLSVVAWSWLVGRLLLSVPQRKRA